MYEPGVVLISQGSKTTYLAYKVYHYDANQYLLLTVPVPIECQTMANKEEPLIGLFIEFDINKLSELVHVLTTGQTMTFKQEAGVSNSIGSGTYDNIVLDVIHRLLNSLHSTIDTKVLGQALVSELYYRLLCGKNATTLYALTLHDGHYARIAKILDKINNDYAVLTTVEEYAKQARMSVSAFHREFKRLFSVTPSQSKNVGYSELR